MIHVSPIKEMELRSAGLPDVVSLAQGIPSFDTPECIKKRAIEAINAGKTARYSLSPGIIELREAIEHDLAQQNIFYDFQKEIIVTAGSIEAITASFLALLEPGDEVLIPDPTYTSYQSAIAAARAISVFVPLDEKLGWAFNIEAFEKRITPKTRAILLCNPNNPTGTVYSKEQLLTLVELAEKHDLYVLSDEVYKDFIYDEGEYFSLAQMPAFRKRVIYIFSFSKAYAMTGWRVAFLATEKSVAEKILGIHDALVTCAPVVSQWAALGALELAKNEVIKFKEVFLARRKIICDKFDEMKEDFSYVMPSSAYFIFPKMTDKLIQKFLLFEKKNKKNDSENFQYEIRPYQINSLSWRFALALLYHAGVATVPGYAFGPSGENHLRLCFGRSEEGILKATEKIKNFVINL